MRRATICCTLVACFSALGQPLRPILPERAGFSRQGLARIDEFFAREIADDRVPGAVVAIARDGKLVYYKAHGFLQKATNQPMPLDAIFNLASMTKIMVSVAGLALNEQGRLPLRARLDHYFPAFSKMGVAQAASSGNQPEIARPITLHDLFRHTSGLPYGARGDSAVQKLYPPSSTAAALEYTGEELLAKLATLPLLHQPGTVWEYGFSTDVLGLVIEKVTGRKLGEVLQEAVWDKVKMPDTGFKVPAQKRGRLARPLPKDPITGKEQSIVLLDRPAKFDCAGVCAFGTVGDFLRFGQMLLDGGAIEGQRVLSPKTVAWMTSDHLGGGIWNRVASIEPHRDGYGFGLGVAVRLQDGVSSVPGTEGDFTWNGATGTAFWADPQERLVVVYGTAAPGEIRQYYREQVSALVYGAMTELRGERRRPVERVSSRAESSP